MILQLIAYVCSCALCGNRYELTRGDGRPPDRPRRCSMDGCCGLVRTTPVYGDTRVSELWRAPSKLLKRTKGVIPK